MPNTTTYYCIKTTQVLATNGDTHLGGEDFDQRVMQYFMKIFKKKTGADITGDNKAIQKLRREVCVCVLNPPATV